MKRSAAFAGLSFLLALLLWALVAWPLARHALDGIPASPLNPERNAPQRMIPGDHLQLLYQLWLAHDTWFGPTPWGHNLYEFNIGDDAARRLYSTYYFPFNLFYGIGHVLGGDALGWNLAAVLSLAVSIGATVLWLRRWAPGRPCLVWCAALLGQCLPYRWHTLLNGSPTGLSLMWVPILLLGLDIWLRDHRTRGAFLAGAAVFLSGWSDAHVFFFGGLLCVFWLVPNLLAVRRPGALGWREVGRLAATGWPLALWAGLSLWQVAAVKGSLQGTNNATGREVREVALFSPPWEHVLDRAGAGGVRETYLGSGLLLFGLALLALVLCHAVRRRNRDAWMRLALFCLGLFVLVAGSLLATGPANPWGPGAWKRLTALLPPLAMLRQPAKVFLLFPPFLAWGCVLGLAVLPRRASGLSALAALLILGPLLTHRIHPRICLLDKGNQAYAAIASHQNPPRALALPLWPGDSHWSSLYLHYAKPYHLRMVNGYRPSLNLAYLQKVFDVFQPFNQGDFSDENLDNLLARGVGHLILHENAFPEKVSPFVAMRTLRAMLEHPRLALLKRDGPVWAFAILAEPLEPRSLAPSVATGSVRSWNFELAEGEATRVTESFTYKGSFARLESPGQELTTPAYAYAMAGHELMWIRARGPGVVEFDLLHGGESFPHDFELGRAEWTWVALEPPARPGPLRPFQLRARLLEGTVDLDVFHLTADDWSPHLETPRFLPAVSFFRAGHAEPESGHVVFEPGRDPADFIFYGPNLPLERGKYRIEFEVESDETPGTELGLLRLRGGTEETLVRAGSTATLSWRHLDDQPWNLEFRYAGRGRLRIHGVRLSPVSPL